eukprot:gene18485-9066_t
MDPPGYCREGEPVARVSARQAVYVRDVCPTDVRAPDGRPTGVRAPDGSLLQDPVYLCRRRAAVPRHPRNEEEAGKWWNGEDGRPVAIPGATRRLRRVVPATPKKRRGEQRVRASSACEQAARVSKQRVRASGACEQLRWEALLCPPRAVHVTVSTCASAGALRDTVIVSPCWNDDFPACGTLSQCSALVSGCVNLSVEAYPDTLTVPPYPKGPRRVGGRVALRGTLSVECSAPPTRAPTVRIAARPRPGAPRAAASPPAAAGLSPGPFGRGHPLSFQSQRLRRCPATPAAHAALRSTARGSASYRILHRAACRADGK